MKPRYAKKSSFRSRTFKRKRVPGRGAAGSVLILTLWVLLILSLFAVALAQGIQQKTLIAQKMQQREQLRLAAEGGLKQALARLKFRNPQTYAPKDSLAADFLMNFSGKVGAADFSIITFHDMNSRINVNYVKPEVMTRLLQAVSRLNDDEAEKLAYALKDYIDEDDHISKYFDKGSERFSYQLGGLKRMPKNAPLEFLSELRYVKGMTADVFDALQPYVTVYGGGPVNLNSASAEVLAALGLDPQTVAQIITMRRGADGVDGTHDDHAFKDASQAVEEIRRYYERKSPPVDLAVFERLVREGHLGVKSDTFEFESQAILPQGTRMNISCIYGLSEGLKVWVER